MNILLIVLFPSNQNTRARLYKTIILISYFIIL